MDVSSSGELALSLRSAFLSGSSGIGTLARAPLGGGVPREILEFVEYASWAPDGKDLAIVRFVDGKNRLEYPAGKVLYESERGLFAVRFSPRGDRIAFLERGGTLYVTDLSGKKEKLAGGIRGIGLAWAPSGREIWLEWRSGSGEGRIVAIDLAGKTRVLARAPGRIILYDIAPDGRALVEHAGGFRRVLGAAPGESKERNLSWFDGSTPIGLSADARTLLLAEDGDAGRGNESFYVRRTDGSPAVKLGDGDVLDLSPDGKWVLVRQEGARELALVPAGTGDAVKLPAAAVEHIDNGVFLEDGRRILFFGAETAATGTGAFYMQEIPAGKPQKVAAGYGFTGRPVSPDGKQILGFGADWKIDLQVIPVGGGEPRAIPNTNTVDPIRWSPDGKSILAFEIGSLPLRIVRVDVATGRREPWKEVGPADLSGVIAIDTILIAPDEKSYVYGYSSSVNSDLYIVAGLK